MGKKDEIRKALASFSSMYGPQNTMLATVESVNEGEFTCVLQDDDNDELKYEDVRLRPVLDGKESVTIFPKVGTWALAVRIEEDEDWMVMAVGEADKVKVIVGDCEWTIKEGFLMKKGSETMKKIMDDLLTGIQLLTVNTNVGPSSVPINIATFIGIKTRVDNFFK